VCVRGGDVTFGEHSCVRGGGCYVGKGDVTSGKVRVIAMVGIPYIFIVLVVIR
jgi:hypothetical protein